MIKYKNTTGKSPIYGYAPQHDSIEIFYRDKLKYFYSAINVGRMNLEKMKLLAENGNGLNHFIDAHPGIKKSYSYKSNW